MSRLNGFTGRLMGGIGAAARGCGSMDLCVIKDTRGWFR